uniref:Peptidase S9 prolyl oligopeptidase catalytic domain-containing protein n=1 Tax=Branchiostoma floridae TaxID=7739 RepID=C3XQV5_BRAFL|eukprot:XP_002613541.1 hypothetical protein BRAFLDRAFT_119810 [Branchiostoma floridae]
MRPLSTLYILLVILYFSRPSLCKKKDAQKSSLQLLEKESKRLEKTGCKSIKLDHVTSLRVNQKWEPATACLVQTLQASSDDGWAWSQLGEVYDRQGEKKKASSCFQQAAKLTGPFVIGKVEIDGDPVASWGGIANVSAARFNKKAVFYSELIQGGESAGERLQVSPQVSWNDLVMSLGSMAITEWQGWMVGEFTVNDNDVKVLVQTLGVPTFYIDNIPVAGEVYHRDQYWFSVPLTRGIHTVYIKLRTKVTQQVTFNIKLAGSNVLEVLAPPYLPDLLDGTVLGHVIPLPIANHHPTHWIKNIRVSLVKQEGGPKGPKVSINQPELSRRFPLAPGQVRIYDVYITTKEGVHMEQTSCQDMKLTLQVSGSEGNSQVVTINLRCRTYGQSFVFTFLDHDGSNKVDTQRVIFAGHSMGGHGAWHLATHHPDRALAVVSLAGWIKKEEYGDSNVFFRLLDGSYTLTVLNPASVEGGRGVQVLQQTVPMRTSTVKMEFQPGQAILVTQNVARFRLYEPDLHPVGWVERSLQVDGVTFEDSRKVTESEVNICKKEGTWSLCSDGESFEYEGQRGPHNMGPARRVAEHRFLIVTGTHGPALVTAQLERLGVYLANLFHLTSDTSAPVVKDTELRTEDAELHNLIVIGGPKENSWAAGFINSVPLGWDEGGMTLGDCRFTHPRTGALFLARHAGKGLSLVLLGNSLSGLEDVVQLGRPTIPPMTRSPFSNLVPDFVLTGPDFQRSGPGGNTVQAHVVSGEGPLTIMDVFTVDTVIAVLSAAAIVVYFLRSQRTPHSSSWPKTKQPLAYIRKVIPKKVILQMPLNSLNDFVPVGEATTVHDVVQLFAHRGNEFSVYSIDWEQEVVVLIRPVDGADLKAHPFFLERRQPGHFFDAVIYYSSLVNDKEKTFRLLMEKLGLNWSPHDSREDTDKIEKALVEDSQAGTSMCSSGRRPGEKWTPDVSSRWMGQWEREYFEEVCHHAGNEITGPDFLLPGTVL